MSDHPTGRRKVLRKWVGVGVVVVAVAAGGYLAVRWYRAQQAATEAAALIADMNADTERLRSEATLPPLPDPLTLETVRGQRAQLTDRVRTTLDRLNAFLDRSEAVQQRAREKTKGEMVIAFMQYGFLAEQALDRLRDRILLLDALAEQLQKREGKS